MSELAETRYGYTTKAAEVGDYRFLRITDITAWGKISTEGAKNVAYEDAAKEFVVRPGDLLMARTGATYGKTTLVDSNEPAIFASYLVRIRFREQALLPEFYWHFAQSSHYWAQVNALVSKGGQPQFNANALNFVRVPVPPIRQQKEIVNILDSFDALASDMRVGLPAEIHLRKKQYVYYRDRLLTFKETVA